MEGECEQTPEELEPTEKHREDERSTGKMTMKSLKMKEQVLKNHQKLGIMKKRQRQRKLRSLTMKAKRMCLRSVPSMAQRS